MKKGDKILAISLVLIIIISFSSIYLYKKYSKSNAKIAIIKQDGKIVKEINLSNLTKPESFTLKTHGTHFNKISVKKNFIRVDDADCPDKVCIKTGWISDIGDSIVCLPNKLIIKIEGNSLKSKDIDDTTY